MSWFSVDLLLKSAKQRLSERSTVYRWLEDNEDFREKYARARELQAERYAAEIIALADTPVEARKA